MQSTFKSNNQNGSETEINTLIIGAGLGGLTLAALMHKRGQHPLVIEKEPEIDFNKSGYMLGMLPMGGRTLNELNARGNYCKKGIGAKKYRVFNHHGKCLKTYSTEPIIEQFGDYIGISRPELVELLLEYYPKSEIKFGTTVKEIRNHEKPEVTFSDGSVDTFDLVVAADGIHSQIRKMLLNEDEYKFYQTHWGGWVTWMDSSPEIQNEYREYWNPGSFLGFYPVKDKIGIFLGGPVQKVKKAGPQKLAQEIKHSLRVDDEAVTQAIKAFDRDEDFFFWDFHDCRSKVWHKGNIVLLGDAADGFLPTAGVGASMAMDSAAALDDELSRADKKHLSFALDLYEKRQKPRVEKAQENSRQFGKIMFMKSPLMVSLRNALLPLYSMDHFLKDIKKVMQGV